MAKEKSPQKKAGMKEPKMDMMAKRKAKQQKRAEKEGR